MSIDEIKKNLREAVNEWQYEKPFTDVTVADFARAFGLRLEYRLAPISPEAPVVQPASPVELDSRVVPRYVEDERIEQAVFGSPEWRKVSGLA